MTHTGESHWTAVCTVYKN